MTSFRVTSQTLHPNQYNILGECDTDDFVRHVAIAAEGWSHNRMSFPVVHMGPPLNRGGAMRADAVGTVVLTVDELEVIKRFAQLHISEHGSTKFCRTNSHQFYCIHPHASPFSESDGRYVRTRFSCVGFVYECYKQAGIQLLDVTNQPVVDLDRIRNCYPVFSRLLDITKSRNLMGLTGDGPWPVMLCGYLFHSLARGDDEIRSTPYCPQASDAHFP